MEFPDAKKDVDTKNVGNKGILDTMHTASEKASGKRVFSTPQARVIQPALGIGQIKLKIHLIPDAMQSALGTTSGIRELKLKGKGRREKRRGFSVCSSPPSVPSSLPSLTVPLLSATLGCVGYPTVMVASVVWRAIMSSSYPRNNFMETDAMFLEFEDDLDNITGASLSVGDNTGSSSQQPATPTLRRCAQSRLLELERHVAINECTPMTIAPGAEKHIFSHVVGFSQAIGIGRVGREYIEVVKGDLQRLFMLDFNDQAMNRFVEHQMLTTFKEFQADCHRHFKKYNDPEEARANPPNALEQSRTNKAARQKQPYNHSSESKSFLQRQYDLAERKEKSIDCVELFWESYV
uniref:CACTA en-spm transposon protein n=1 Tax=Cucumis melo TaxID=3656 RepID=A0A9I9DRG4_CUCME